jgi:hypothetical protein
MDNYTDAATVVIPGICKLVQQNKSYTIVPSGMAFKEGLKVLIEAGYNGINTKRFEGFINRINFKLPVELECEGYSYQLKKRPPFTGTFVNTPLKKLLEKLVQGTNILLSDKIPDVNVTYARFSNCSGLQVLDWLKDKMLLTAYFNYNSLYVGLRYTETVGNAINHRLNWNVIKDNDLLLEQNKQPTKINIELATTDKKGGYKRLPANTKIGNKKVLRITAIDVASSFANQLQADKEKQANFAGYTGKLTTFLQPIAEKNDVSNIIDKKYQERNSKNIIEGIEGSLSKNGGRQLLQIGIAL